MPVHSTPSVACSSAVEILLLAASRGADFRVNPDHILMRPLAVLSDVERAVLTAAGPTNRSSPKGWLGAFRRCTYKSPGRPGRFLHYWLGEPGWPHGPESACRAWSPCLGRPALAARSVRWRPGSRWPPCSTPRRCARD